ncbi:MAG: pantetheine-phosphate adenylyltransferase [Verrucomicrobiae bacterium]|nr:pantetheine-phosphate adenylyltransferase [Verrucomicrobiae bacterium]
MSVLAIYPGSFDPLTNGHLDVLQRASRLFDEVVLAIAHETEKNPLFTVQERVDLAREAIRGIKNARVEEFKQLLVDYVQEKGARVIIRGLRAVSDFEWEFQMALMNRNLAPSVETIFLMPRDSYSYLSSRMTKQIAQLGGDISSFVAPHIEKALRRRYGFAD